VSNGGSEAFINEMSNPTDEIGLESSEGTGFTSEKGNQERGDEQIKIRGSPNSNIN
jgi:hypothetical protein